MSTPHFIISYSRGDEANARLVARYAEEAFASVAKDLGYDISSSVLRVPVRVYSSRPDFVTGTGIDRRNLTVGRAWSGTEKIEIDGSGTFSRVEQITAHEVTHIVIARVLGPRVAALPLWANEGIAKVESNDSGFKDDEAVGAALADGSFIPLKQLSHKFPSSNERSALAYSESASFMRFIRERTGPQVFEMLLRETAAIGDFEEAFYKSVGGSLNSFEAAWKRSISKSYAGNWLAHHFTTVVGITMALLCVAAYFAIKRKKRWRSAQWMIEDYNDGLDYGPPPD